MQNRQDIYCNKVRENYKTTCVNNEHKLELGHLSIIFSCLGTVPGIYQHSY